MTPILIGSRVMSVFHLGWLEWSSVSPGELCIRTADGRAVLMLSGAFMVVRD